MTDECAAFEAEEIRGLAQRFGATREYTADGIGYYSFPPYICATCGLEPEPRAECPDPLARHGPLDEAR